MAPLQKPLLLQPWDQNTVRHKEYLGYEQEQIEVLLKIKLE